MVKDGSFALGVMKLFLEQVILINTLILIAHIVAGNLIGVNILMLTKEECEKAFKMLNSLITHSPFKEDHRDYNDLKINNSRLQNEFMDAVMVLKFLIDEHFTPNALTFEDLINIRNKNKHLIIYDKNNAVPLEAMLINPQNETFRCFVGGAKNLIKFKFEKNRYYLIQIPEVDI